MLPRVVVFSYPRLTLLIKKALGDTPVPVELEFVEAVFDELVSLAKEREVRGDAHVFISAGSNAQLLKKHLSRPIVSIDVTAFDLLQAIRQASQKGEVVAVGRFSQPLPELQDIADLLKVKIRQFSYDNYEEARRKIAQLKEAGIRALVERPWPVTWRKRRAFTPLRFILPKRYDPLSSEPSTWPGRFKKRQRGRSA
ncbi:MAG: PrpR N-terminal domain-containing protein [Firmicutes bacterium]|nr:PrpR N-terminal domain-containing protein [Bacillota bacterium]MCL5039673.1 PrpR N-terminal domain-containing protein [Bacillota bacterium]